MTPERYKRIGAIFAEAADLEAEKAKALETQTGVPCPVQRTQRN